MLGNMRLIAIWIWVCWVATVGAQPSAASAIKARFRAVERGEVQPLKRDELNRMSRDPEALALASPYLSAEDERIRKEAIRLVSQLGLNATQPNARTQAVRALLELATRGSAAELDMIASRLKKFLQPDFDVEARLLLMGLIEAQRPQLSDWILIAGFVGMRDPLLGLRGTYKAGSPNAQALSLALARSGSSALDGWLDQLRSQAIDDRFVYQVAPLLIYTRQKAATDYLLDIILSDDRSCTPADAETSGRILCAYRLMEMLAPVIVDFPVKATRIGQLEVDDYEQALQTVRQWVLAYKNDYILDNQSY